ncbi:MAG: trypsin-like peptidase domain-containing protein [Gammaproteobacteria bacterium]|nr:trypsin-like peptidase domain-containing protein [Gammaproteobacteria bacterium]
MRRYLGFLAGCAVGGLALAFVAVLARPELLRPQAAAASIAAPAASPAVAAATAAAPETRRTSYADAVERTAPAVVNVYTARVVTERVPASGLEPLFGELWPRYRQRIERSLGSGVIVDGAGHIVTNHHVVAGADTVRVQLADGRVADAQVVGRDPDTDLAVLEINLTGLPVMPLGHSDRLRVGDVVLAIGNPLGLSQTVTQGIVSATGRGQLGVATFENFIQTDASINFGNSGGALVSAEGELVGINTAIVGRDAGVEGIGFAIPVNLVRGVVHEIIAHGRVVRGWIGIVPQDLTADEARGIGLARGGVVIANLYVGSPAQAAGLMPGDLLMKIDGSVVRSAQDAAARVAGARPGQRLRLAVLRGERELDLVAGVVEQPRRS